MLVNTIKEVKVHTIKVSIKTARGAYIVSKENGLSETSIAITNAGENNGGKLGCYWPTE